MSHKFVQGHPLNFRKLLLSISLSLILLCFTVASFALAAPYKVNEVKAAYLYQIANFVKWVDEDNRNKLYFCIRDDLDLSNTFARITKGKTIRGLEVVTNQKEMECDVLYIGNVLKQSDYTTHSLTISSNKGFIKRGGIIELAQIKNKIQPIVNFENSKSDFFTISSKFMRIAKIERGQK